MANDLVPSGGEDGSLVVSVDSRKALAGLNVLEARIYGFVNNTQTAFNRVANSTAKFASSISTLNKLLSTIGSFIAIRQVIQMIEGFLSRMIEVNRVFTGFIASMSIIRGSVDSATKEYKFLLDMSNKLGVSVESSITQYHRLAAALKNVDKTGELTRHIFSGISQAAVVLHSKGRDVTLIFEAVQQMASKGKLSLEELQRQLGNTLPGAIGIASRAMMKSEDFVKAGVKNAAEAEQMLRKGIQKGTINVYEFLARLSNQLKKEYGQGVQYASDQFTANFNRMKNSVFEFYRVVGSSGAMTGLTDILREITALFNDNDGQGAAGLGKALGGVFQNMASWISKLDSTDIKEFFESIRIAITSTFTVVDEFLGIFKQMGTPEMETPLLDFVEFCAKTMAALVDIFRVAVAGIETVIRGIGDIFYNVREVVMGMSDQIMNAASYIPGIADSTQVTGYQKMRAEQKATRDANADAFGTAAHTFIVGPDQNAYDKVSAQFDAARQGLMGSKYGIPGTANFGYKPATIDAATGMPSFMTPASTKAGSTADSAAAYVNPMGDAELQKLLDDIKNNSNPPSGNGNGKGTKAKHDPVQSNFLKEQTRLLKDISVAENEYQNVLSNRNLHEGQAVAQMRSLISTDERYVALSDEKKGKLMDWAQQLDDANRKVEDAIKAQGAMNDALQTEIDARGRIGELLATGYESKYRAVTDTQNSFQAGGENEFMAQENRRKAIEAAVKKDNADRILDMARYRAEVELTTDEMYFQNSLIGKSRQEQQQAIEFHKIDLQIQQMSVGATKEQIAEYKRMADVLKTDVGGALDDLYAKQDDMWGGIQRGIQGYMDANSDWAAQMSDITVNALGGIEDAFVSMVETGKLSFADLTRSIAKDLVRLIVRYLLVWFLQKMTGLGAMGGGGGGGSSGGSFSGGFDVTGGSSIAQGGGYGGGGLPGYSKGGAFAGGIELFGKGGVFAEPFAFPMAGNKMGVGAEVAPEAIMPLAKDSSGRLGVRRVDGGNSGHGDGETTLNLTVEVYQGKGDGVRTEKSQGSNGDILKVFIGEVAADIQKGGPVAKALTTTYGLRRSAKTYS